MSGIGSSSVQPAAKRALRFPESAEATASSALRATEPEPGMLICESGEGRGNLASTYRVGRLEAASMKGPTEDEVLVNTKQH